MTETIIDRIGELVEIDWQKDLLELQPDDIKVKTNKEDLKNSILKYGFALPLLFGRIKKVLLRRWSFKT